MDKNENIIPQIIYLMILNINYNNTFDKLRFKFEILFYYLEVYDIRFFILIQFIYFVNSIIYKSTKIFIILFYYLHYFPFNFHFKFIISPCPSFGLPKIFVN